MSVRKGLALGTLVIAAVLAALYFLVLPLVGWWWTGVVLCFLFFYLCVHQD